MIGAAFMPSFYFHFITDILKIFEKNKIAVYLSYAYSIFFALISLPTNWFVKGVEHRLFFKFWPVPGELFSVFLAIFFGLFIYSWVLLFVALKKTPPGNEKNQIKFLLFGVIPGAIGGATNYPLWYNIPFPPWGSILTSAFVMITAIGLIRYRLFNIKAILTEVLVITMGIVLVFLPFLMTDFRLKALTTGIFLFYCVIGYLLIVGTLNEVRAKETLEQKVQERTKELETSKKVAEERAQELEKWYNLTIGRELKMAELKKKIGEMEERKK
jgi:hypothetical protein